MRNVENRGGPPIAPHRKRVGYLGVAGSNVAGETPEGYKSPTIPWAINRTQLTGYAMSTIVTLPIGGFENFALSLRASSLAPQPTIASTGRFALSAVQFGFKKTIAAGVISDGLVFRESFGEPAESLILEAGLTADLTGGLVGLNLDSSLWVIV